MATVTMTSVANLLKEIYENDLKDQLNTQVTALRRIERTSRGVTNEVGGKYVAFPLRTRRNHGIGARAEMSPLPVPRTQGYEQARVQLKHLYGGVEMSGQTFELADTNQQAFVDAVDEEIRGLRENLVKDVNRQVFGTNKGVLVTATAAGTTTTFVAPNGVAPWMEVGMVVDVYNSANTLQTGGPHEITDITIGATDTTYTFAPARAGTPATGDYMTRTGSLNQEITGLAQIVDNTGTLFNVNGTSVPVWRSYKDVTGGNISEGVMVKTVHEIWRASGKSPSVAFTTLGVMRAYFNLLSQQRRYSSETGTKKFDGGFEGLGFITDKGEVPIVSDNDVPKGLIYWLAEKELKIYQSGDWGFMDRDGSQWHRKQANDAGVPGNYDAYFLYFYKYMELGTSQRNAHGVQTGITEAG